MNSPTMLYRCPGSQEFEGVSCETTIVDEADIAAHKDAGWHADWMLADAAHKEVLAQIAANEAEQKKVADKLAGGKKAKG